MTKAHPSPLAEALAADDDLVFVDLPHPAPAAEPAAKPRTGKAKKAPAAAPKPEIPESAPAPAAAAEEPADAPAIPPADDASAGSATSPAAGPARPTWRDRALLGIALVAMLGSVASFGAVIEVGRTLAHAQADRDQARAELHALDHIPQTITAIDAASDRLSAAAARAAAASAASPATQVDLHREIDALKLSLNNHQPDGVAQLQSAYREGFTDLGTRLDQIDDRIDALSAKISAGRRASPAGDRARPS